MKAAVFHKPKDVRFEDVPDPAIEDPRDAIIRVTSTALCGSDLHIFNGFFPQFSKMILGQEFMGVVEELGSEVRNLKKGDRVVVPFPIACGRCYFCEQGVPNGCENSNPQHWGPQGGIIRQKGGAMFGYTDLYGGYDGGQAEAVRVPYADFGPRKVPDSLSDEQALFLGNTLATAWSGVDWAGIRGGETVVVFGCGPVGLAAMKCAWARGAGRVIAVDILSYRLSMAKEAGHAEVINADLEDPVEKIIEITNGRGADAVIDAVGMDADRSFIERAANALHMQAGTIKVFNQTFSAVRRGGRVAIIGVYGSNYDNFPLGQWMDKGVQVRMGQAPVHIYLDELLLMMEGGKIATDDLITHRLPLSEVVNAYRLFNKKEDGCVKVVMKP